METISLLVKTRNGVAVNETQLFNIDDIVGPLNSSGGGADSIFVYREGKKGPFSNAPGGSFLTTFVVDETLPQIEILGIAIFTANVISQSGRPVLSTPLRGFNANYICGPVRPFNGGSVFMYQEDTNSDLVEYIVTQTPAQILVQIQFTGGSGSGTGDITGNLTANYLPVATSSKNITDSVCTYISGTLTLRGSNGSNIITVGAAGLNLASSSTTITSSTTIMLNATGKINIVANGVAASQILSLDSSGNLTSVNVSPTQILYVNTFTSDPQAQINNKIGGTLTPGLMPYASAAKVISDTQLFFDGTSKWGFMTVSPTTTVHINGSFRLVDGSQAANRILSCNASGVTTWIDPPAAGMTNVLTTTGDIIQANPGSTPTRLAAVATGNVLLSGGVGAVNSWGKVGLTTHVTGVLLPGSGGSGTSTVMTPGSVLFAGASGVYSQDNANFFYDISNAALRLGGATYNTAVLNVKPQSSRSGIHVDMSAATGGYAGLIIIHADPSTSYIVPGTAQVVLANTSTTVNSNSLIRFWNGGVGSAVMGSLYTNGSHADFVIGVSKLTGDVNHSAIYIKGATTAVAIGYDLKTPTATLHLIGSTTAQSSLRIGVATALPTGASRFAGDINFTTQRYYGYKTDNTAEEAFAYLSDITGLYVKLDGTTPLTGNWNAGAFAITANGVILGGSVTGITITGKSIGLTIYALGDGIQVNANGNAIVANGDTIGGQFTSINTAGKFYQSGILGANSTSNTVSIVRDITLNGNTNTGAMLFMNNVTASTGNFITIADNGTTKIAIKSTGVLQYIDGNQASGKVLTSDASGNASWVTPGSGFTNPMTTIADIIQAGSGGTPQRLAGSATAGTFLRSQGTGVINQWSTFVLPNAATQNSVFFATGPDTMGSLTEFNYNPTSNLLSLIKSANAGVSFSTTNLSAGTAAIARFVANAGTGNISIGATSAGNTGSFGADAQYIDGSGGTGIIINHNSNVKFAIGATEIARFQSGGLCIGVPTAPDGSCLIDMHSTTKGLRIPRMTTAQRTAISTGSKPGVLVYDTDFDKLYCTNNAGTWVPQT